MAGISLLRPRSWTQRGVAGVAIVLLHLGIVAIATISKVNKVDTAETLVVAVTLLDNAPTQQAPALPQVALLQPSTVPVEVPEVLIDVEKNPAPAITASAPVADDSVAVRVTATSSGSANPEVVSDIEYVRVTPAAYPAVAVRQRIEDIVYVKVIVDEEGRVATAAVQNSGGYRVLDDAAIEAVQGWLFRPYVRNGVSMRVAAIVPVKFSLRVRTAQTR